MDQPGEDLVRGDRRQKKAFPCPECKGGLVGVGGRACSQSGVTELQARTKDAAWLGSVCLERDDEAVGEGVSDGR